MKTLVLVATTANTSTVRVATPGATILKSTPGAIQQTIGGKQIITVHKASTGGSSSTGQPQIVTLVKTNQGMQVATVSYLAPLSVVWHHCQLSGTISLLSGTTVNNSCTSWSITVVLKTILMIRKNL